jgi:ABC-type multidrug transport system ATPase subunit
MYLPGRLSEDALVLDELCKSYGSFAAVSNLSFGVHHGECFGLLGVNGAGKTTTFRMLTGDEIRSCGNAYNLMHTLQKNRKEFLSSIGYCPQFDGIVGVLTGKEMLQLFCRLRGVESRSVEREADQWMQNLGEALIECPSAFELRSQT